MKPLSSSRAQRWAALVVGGALFGVGFLPLFGGPGYEHALASGLLVPCAAAIATSYDSNGRQWRVTVSTAPTITVPVAAGGFAIVQR